MYRIWFISLGVLLLISSGLNVSAEANSDFRLSETILTIKQVDYEDAIYYTEEDPYPHLSYKEVRNDVVVDKEHRAVIMENPYIELTLLPEMGRVYSLVYKATGHEVFWRNDIVTVGGANNDCRWWIWIGGAEYTLPGDEHGTTWAETWQYHILEDSDVRKAVQMSVVERGTGLEEDIDIVLYPDRSYYEAHIRITNPTEEVVQYAHWINPMWTPGGHNELTDNTEFIIPTESILIPEWWQANLGPSPQEWATSKLRFINGWDGAGDLMADGLNEGFYSAYSHDEEEGVVRIFDKDINPGMDMWTYGYHTTHIPMGSGAPNKGYAEMWGGTSKLYPDERHPIAPGEVIEWTEWMYPYQRTGGLTYANRDVALHFVKYVEDGTATLGLCPSKRFDSVQCMITSGDVLLFEDTLELAPDQPFKYTMTDLRGREGIKVMLTNLSEPAHTFVGELEIEIAAGPTGISTFVGELPYVFRLYAPYPNPFNPVTHIAYDLPEAEHVHLTVYTIVGQYVATLHSGHQESGRHEAIWDGSGMASGVYFYRLQAGSFAQVKRMLFLR